VNVAVDISPGVTAGVGRWQRETVRVLAQGLVEVTKVSVFAFKQRTERPGWMPEGAEYRRCLIPGRGQKFLTNWLRLPIELVCGLGRPEVILGLNLHPLRAKAPVLQGVADVSWRSFSNQYRHWFNAEQIHLAEQAIARANHVLTISRGSADDLVRGGIPANRVTIAHLGVTEEFRNVSSTDVDRVRARYALPEKFVLYMGAVNERKNIPVLTAAMGSLGGDVPLVMAGPMPLEPLAFWKLDRPWIRHLGYIPESDVPGLYAAAAIEVFPSKLEGYGLPLVEAMAAGTPVIAADTAVFREVAEDAVSYFPPDDQSELARLIRIALGSAGFQEEYRGRGRQLAARRTWQKYGENLLAALQAAAR
jgi:glycosyltransferase involved in cell wall biosynthesis